MNTQLCGGYIANPAPHSTGNVYNLIGQCQTTSFGGAATDYAGMASPMAGTLQKLHVRQSAVGGVDRIYTVYRNGVATTLVATVPAGATEASDVAHTVAVSVYDVLCLQITGGNGLTAMWTVELDAPAALVPCGLIGAYTTLEHGVTGYCWLNSRNTDSLAVETQAYGVAPCDGTISHLTTTDYLPWGPWGGHHLAWYWQITLRVNGVSTALSITNFDWGWHLTNQNPVAVDVHKGDYLDWLVEVGGGAADPAAVSWGAIFTPIDPACNVWTGSPVPLDAANAVPMCLQPASAQDGSAMMVQGSGLAAARLYVRLSAAPGAAASGHQYTFTLYRNGAPTTLTCIAFETATFAEDMVNLVALANGDTLYLRCVPLNNPDVVNGYGGIILEVPAPTIISVVPNSAERGTP